MILKKTKELYGDKVNPTEWENMLYVDVLELKIKLAADRIEELNADDLMRRESTQIYACMESIKLCNKLIKETKEGPQ